MEYDTTKINKQLIERINKQLKDIEVFRTTDGGGTSCLMFRMKIGDNSKQQYVNGIESRDDELKFNCCLRSFIAGLEINEKKIIPYISYKAEGDN